MDKRPVDSEEGCEGRERGRGGARRGTKVANHNSVYDGQESARGFCIARESEQRHVYISRTYTLYTHT